MLTPDQVHLLQTWHHAAATAAQWIEYERKCRDAFVAATFPDDDDGTFRADAGNGYSVKLLRTTRLDVADVPPMRQLVNKFAAFGETSDAGQALLKWKPRLSVRAYKALPSWGRAMMDQYVTSTPNAPQLELIAPKG